MPKFNSAFQIALKGTSTKLAWGTLFKNLTSPGLRLRCFASTNANSVDPSVDGEEFINVASDGNFTLSGGNIVGFGMLSDSKVKKAANLAVGKAILRLEGNGYTFTATLGLPGSGAEYVLSKNPTGNPNEGISFTAGSGIKAPKFYPSGTGPFQPGIRAATPTVVKLVSCIDPTNKTVVGTSKVNVRKEDWVFEVPFMAAEMGDIGIYQMASPIKWAEAGFELGGTLFLGNNHNTIDGVTPLEQMLMGWKPMGAGNWETYPAMDTYVRANWENQTINGVVTEVCTNAATASKTYPPPYEIHLETETGQLVHIYQMDAFNAKPNLPINSPLLSQWWTETEPVVPHVNIGQLLPWQNIQTRISSRMKNIIGGFTANSYAPKCAKSGDSVNPAIPFYSAYSQTNSAGHMYGLPPYPMRRDLKFGDQDADVKLYDPGPRDPNLFDKSTYRDYEGKPVRMTGYMFQYGSITGHDGYMAKGGARFDRSPVPSLLAILVSKPDYLRPDGNVPIRKMWDNFSMAYFNHTCHYLRDVTNFTTVPKSEIEAGSWVLASAYYGGGPYGSQGQYRGPQNTVQTCGIMNGNNRTMIHNDASGRMPWGGRLRDHLHSYAYPSWAAVANNSPMHAFANIFHYNEHWMCSLGSAAADVDIGENFLSRGMSGRWLAYTMQWVVGTQHPMGISCEEIERRFQVELETLHRLYYTPAFVENSQSMFNIALRNLGVYLTEDKNGVLGSSGGTLGLYIADVFAMMKQFGLLDRMKSRSQKNIDVFKMVIDAFDKQAIDYVLDTKGRDNYYQVLSGFKVNGASWTAAAISTNWAAQGAMLDQLWPVIPADFSGNLDYEYYHSKRIDWGTDYRGNACDACSTQHLQYKWATMRKRYLTEYPHPRLDAAIAKFEGYYAAMKARADAGFDTEARYLMPSHGGLLAPLTVGPPA